MTATVSALRQPAPTPLSTSPSTLASPPVSRAVERVPTRVRIEAAEAGWPTCDVCSWPVDAAALVPGKPARHPSCSCATCGIPLRHAGEGELTCPEHRPVAPVRHLRTIRGRR